MEIIASNEFDLALKENNITGKRIYSGSFGFDKYGFGIWYLDNKNFELLYNIDANSWLLKWGWWRWCSGDWREKNPIESFIVNNKKVLLYYSKDALDEYADSLLREDDWPFTGEIPLQIKESFLEKYRNNESIFDYYQKMWNFKYPESFATLIYIDSKINGLSIKEFLERFSKEGS